MGEHNGLKEIQEVTADTRFLMCHKRKKDGPLNYFKHNTSRVKVGDMYGNVVMRDMQYNCSLMYYIMIYYDKVSVKHETNNFDSGTNAYDRCNQNLVCC